jgi:hypothetical protein
MISAVWWGLAVAQAASVTVSPGDDLNALTSSLQPGDIVTFNPGTYELEGTVNWTGIGTEADPIEFRAKQPGTAVLRNMGGGYVAYLSDSEHVKVLGLIFEGGGDDISYTQPSGIGINNSTNITLEDNVIRDVWGTALRIEGNTSGLVIHRNELGPTGDGTGLHVGCWEGECWMQDSLIEFNLIHQVAHNGIYLLPGTQGCTIQHNVIYQAGETGIVVPDTLFGPQNIVFGNAIWQTVNDGMYIYGSALVQNNLIFEIGGDGIETSNENYESLVDLQISHNTIARTDGWGAELRDWYDRPDLVFANNAIANPTGYGLYWEDLYYVEDYYGYTTTTGEDTSNYISHNVVTGLVDGFDELLRSTFVIPGGGIADYESIEDWDFYPTGTSELRDAGDPAGLAYIPQEDFNGTARDGESPDVGAYEYDGDGNPGWKLAESFKSYSPSEGRDVTATRGGCCGGGGKSGETDEALLLLPLLGLGALRRRRSR